jgi:hypothetical protein
VLRSLGSACRIRQSWFVEKVVVTAAVIPPAKEET